MLWAAASTTIAVRNQMKLRGVKERLNTFQTQLAEISKKLIEFQKIADVEREKNQKESDSFRNLALAFQNLTTARIEAQLQGEKDRAKALNNYADAVIQFIAPHLIWRKKIAISIVDETHAKLLVECWSRENANMKKAGDNSTERLAAMMNGTEEFFKLYDSFPPAESTAKK